MDNIQYVESDLFKAKMVSLPFKPNRFSLLLILPKKRHRIDYVERKIKNYGLQQLFSGDMKTYSTIDIKMLILEIDSGKKEKVAIGLPKFKVHHKVNLKEAFEDMGVTDMFTGGKADFSNMMASKRRDIYLSSVSFY